MRLSLPFFLVIIIFSPNCMYTMDNQPAKGLMKSDVLLEKDFSDNTLTIPLTSDEIEKLMSLSNIDLESATTEDLRNAYIASSLSQSKEPLSDAWKYSHKKNKFYKRFKTLVGKETKNLLYSLADHESDEEKDSLDPESIYEKGKSQLETLSDLNTKEKNYEDQESTNNKASKTLDNQIRELEASLELLRQKKGECISRDYEIKSERKQIKLASFIVQQQRQQKKDYFQNLIMQHENEIKKYKSDIESYQQRINSGKESIPVLQAMIVTQHDRIKAKNAEIDKIKALLNRIDTPRSGVGQAKKVFANWWNGNSSVKRTYNVQESKEKESKENATPGVTVNNTDQTFEPVSDFSTQANATLTNYGIIQQETVKLDTESTLNTDKDDTQKTVNNTQSSETKSSSDPIFEIVPENDNSTDAASTNHEITQHETVQQNIPSPLNAGSDTKQETEKISGEISTMPNQTDKKLHESNLLNAISPENDQEDDEQDLEIGEQSSAENQADEKKDDNDDSSTQQTASHSWFKWWGKN